MGKKKSVVLMVLLTIVIVVFSVVTLVPFPIFGTPQSFNPTIWQYDLGADLGGGYYAYYYPEGVKTELEMEADEEDKADYIQNGSLYLSKDEQYGLVKDGAISQTFKTDFAKAAKAIADRFENKGYSDYRVAVVDDYALRVEVPSSDATVSETLTIFNYTGAITLEKSGTLMDEFAEDGAKASDFFSGFSVATQYDVAYIKISLTSAGYDLIEGVKDELSTSDNSSSSDAVKLTLKVGDNTITDIYQDNYNNGELRIMFYAEENKAAAETYVALLNSSLSAGDLGVDFRTVVANGDIRSFNAVYGDNAQLLLYIAIAVIFVAIVALGIVKMGRFGVVNAYASLSYLLVVATCYAFLLGSAAFEFTLGSVLVFLIGLVLINVLQVQIYDAIKAEFNLGKTVESSVKGGYKKTLWGVVDIYALSLIAAIALFIGAAGMQALAIQALICIVMAAFCNLLWARAINFTFLSASKNKYKYFRFVREEDEDDE